MSAFICSDKHFSVIAHSIEAFDCGVNAQELADKLKSINIESVNYRYKEKTRKTKCKLQNSKVGENYSKSDIIQLINSWNYQSCEKPDNLEYVIMSAFLYSFFTKEELENSRFNSELNWSI